MPRFINIEQSIRTVGQGGPDTDGIAAIIMVLLKLEPQGALIAHLSIKSTSVIS